MEFIKKDGTHYEKNKIPINNTCNFIQFSGYAYEHGKSAGFLLFQNKEQQDHKSFIWFCASRKKTLLRHSPKE